jgi:hypothetical protein
MSRASKRDRWFEFGSLQRGVQCELGNRLLTRLFRPLPRIRRKHAGIADVFRAATRLRPLSPGARLCRVKVWQ